MGLYEHIELLQRSKIKIGCLAIIIGLVFYVPTYANESANDAHKESTKETTSIKDERFDRIMGLLSQGAKDYVNKERALYTLANPDVMKMSLKEKKRYYLAKADEMNSISYTDQKRRFYLLDDEPEHDRDKQNHLETMIAILIIEGYHLIREAEPKANDQDPRYFPFMGYYATDITKGYLSHPLKGRSTWAEASPHEIINAEDFELFYFKPLFETYGSYTLYVDMIFTYLKGGDEFYLHKQIEPTIYRLPKVIYSDEDQKLMDVRRNKPVVGYKNYDLGDFEYKTSDTLDFKKKQLIEKKYETIYLYIKAAGLLRRVPSAFYPKSFLREYADQTGLTKFIQDTELKVGRQLSHDELAEQFFGSYDIWMTGFEQFLQNKISTLKIGE